jgi:uncharacterized protein YbjT (DUF2867 family)
MTYVSNGAEAKLLVVGATGNVGNELVEQLVEMGQRVRILVRDPSKIREAERNDVLIEPVIGDLDKPDTLGNAMEGIERLFLITGSTQQDRNILDVGKTSGLQHIVKLSTQEAGWVPVKGHGFWHHEREELIKASGLSWTFLRPCMFMTAATSWTPMIKEKGVVNYPGGTGKIAPIDPWDVAAVARVVLTSSGHEQKGYELTGPELLTFGDMTKILSDVLGKPIQYLEESDADFVHDLLQAHLPQYVADGLASTFSYVRMGDFAHLTDSVEKLTGVKPRTFKQWCQEHKTSFV